MRSPSSACKSYSISRASVLPVLIHLGLPPCRLNSRETRSSVAIFDSGTYGLKAIERTNRRAAAETWNVPQVRIFGGGCPGASSRSLIVSLCVRQIPENEPAPINIRVTTELEDGQNWGGKKHPGETSSSDLDCGI